MIGLAGSCTHAEITADYIQSKPPQKYNLSVSEADRSCPSFPLSISPALYFPLFRFYFLLFHSCLYLSFVPVTIPVSFLPPSFHFTVASIPLIESRVRVPDLRVASVFQLKRKQIINRPTDSQNWNLSTWIQNSEFAFAMLRILLFYHLFHFFPFLCFQKKKPMK